MLSGGMAGRFLDPIQGNPTKVESPALAPKGTCIGFPNFSVFGANGLTVSRFSTV